MVWARAYIPPKAQAIKQGGEVSIASSNALWRSRLDLGHCLGVEARDAGLLLPDKTQPKASCYRLPLARSDGYGQLG